MSTENNLESKTKKITNCLYVYMFIVHNNTIQYNTIRVYILKHYKLL